MKLHEIKIGKHGNITATPLKKRRIKRNIWGNWNGYEGNRRSEDFGLDEWKALEWCLRRTVDGPEYQRFYRAYNFQAKEGQTF